TGLDQAAHYLIALRQVADGFLPVTGRHRVAPRQSTGSWLGGRSVASLPATSMPEGTGMSWHTQAIGTRGSPGTTAGRSVRCLSRSSLLALLPKVSVTAPASIATSRTRLPTI